MSKLCEWLGCCLRPKKKEEKEKEKPQIKPEEPSLLKINSKPLSPKQSVIKSVSPKKQQAENVLSLSKASLKYLDTNEVADDDDNISPTFLQNPNEKLIPSINIEKFFILPNYPVMQLYLYNTSQIPINSPTIVE